jgi:hypothetical protein
MSTCLAREFHDPGRALALIGGYPWKVGYACVQREGCDHQVEREQRAIGNADELGMDETVGSSGARTR